MDSFVKKIIKITGIVSLIILLIAFFIKGFKLLLLVISGILIATFFRGIASFLKSKLPIGDNFAVVLSLLITTGVFVGIFFILSPRISNQFESFQKQLPNAIENAKEYILSKPIGNNFKSYVQDSNQILSTYGSKLSKFFSSFLGGLTNLYIIFFLGLFFMFQPNLYVDGIVKLFPKYKRKRTKEILQVIGYTLKRWLLGKLFSMLLVGVLTGIGLYFLGIPLALTLGLFAAIITFIPNFGPILSLIPALLLALLKGPDYALYVIILYVGIQAVESNLITPLIQNKMISFPLAMVLIAQVALGIFTGILGIILAVPIVAILMVIIKMAYIEDILKDYTIKVKGEEKFT